MKKHKHIIDFHYGNENWDVYVYLNNKFIGKIKKVNNGWQYSVFDKPVGKIFLLLKNAEKFIKGEEINKKETK